jgi:hypothetical protein
LNHDKFGPALYVATDNNMEHTRKLRQDLNVIAELLRKYRHYGQARVVEEVLATLETSSPDYKHLRGTDVWGGAGAVWEVNLGSSQGSTEEKTDRAAFFRAFVRLANTMNHAGFGTDRSRFIGETFQSWLENGL